MFIEEFYECVLTKLSEITDFPILENDDTNFLLRGIMLRNEKVRKCFFVGSVECIHELAMDIFDYKNTPATDTAKNIRCEVKNICNHLQQWRYQNHHFCVCDVQCVSLCFNHIPDKLRQYSATLVMSFNIRKSNSDLENKL